MINDLRGNDVMITIIMITFNQIINLITKVDDYAQLWLV